MPYKTETEIAANTWSSRFYSKWVPPPPLYRTSSVVLWTLKCLWGFRVHSSSKGHKWNKKCGKRSISRKHFQMTKPTTISYHHVFTTLKFPSRALKLALCLSHTWIVLSSTTLFKPSSSKLCQSSLPSFVLMTYLSNSCTFSFDAMDSDDEEMELNPPTYSSQVSGARSPSPSELCCDLWGTAVVVGRQKRIKSVFVTDF